MPGYLELQELRERRQRLEAIVAQLEQQVASQQSADQALLSFANRPQPDPVAATPEARDAQMERMMPGDGGGSATTMDYLRGLGSGMASAPVGPGQNIGRTLEFLMSPPEEGAETDQGKYWGNLAKGVAQFFPGFLELPRKALSLNWQDKVELLYEVEAMLPSLRGDLRSSLGEVLGPIYDSIAGPLGDEEAVKRLAMNPFGPAAAAIIIGSPFASKSAKANAARAQTLAEGRAAVPDWSRVKSERGMEGLRRTEERAKSEKAWDEYQQQRQELGDAGSTKPPMPVRQDVAEGSTPQLEVTVQRGVPEVPKPVVPETPKPKPPVPGQQALADARGAREALAKGEQTVLEPGQESMKGGLGISSLKSPQERYQQKLRDARRKRNQTVEQGPPHDPKQVSGDIADEPSFIIGRPLKDLGPSANIRTPSNLFGAVPGQPARYGRVAQSATRELIKTERDMIVDAGKRGERIEQAINKVDKKDWGKQGEKFYDHVRDPSRDAEMSSGSREAAGEIRKIMREERQYIIDDKRARLNPSVAKLVNREWRQKNGLTNKKLTDAQKAERDQAVRDALKERVPDDWGIENYLPQIHPGNWEVFAEIGGKPYRVGSARSPMDAITKAMEHYADHPELTPESYYTTGRAFIPPDVLRTSRRRLYKTVSEIAKAADNQLSRESISAALRGKIGARESRQKFAGFLEHRKDAPGFTKDFMKVMSVHNQQFVRWKHLTELNPRMTKYIRQIRNEGRRGVADHIEGTWNYLWGQSASPLSRQFDAAMQKTPFLRDRVRPLALERWTGYVRGGIMTTFLKLSLRFHLLNRGQTWQTLWPEISQSEWKAGKDFYYSPAGRAAREAFGIKYLTGGKLLEGGRAITKPGFRERLRGLAPETFNQEVAWSTMFKKAKDMGMSDAAANNYALLKGNLHTQFLHLRTDVPKLLRGPITSTVFQFKRFSIKYLEQAYDLIQSRDTPAVSKWIGVHLAMGGAKMASRTAQVAAGSYLTMEAYNAIKGWATEQGKEMGLTEAQAKRAAKGLADIFAFGAPGALGLDMSYSIQAIDMPFGETVEEKVGNLFMGPAGSLIAGGFRAAIDTKGSESSAVKRVAKSVVQRVPALRWIEALQAFGEKLDSGEYVFRDAAGRQKFRADLQDLIVKALGGRTTKEGENDLLIEGALYIHAQRDEVLDSIVADLVKDYNADIRGRVVEWNENWPEFPITGKSIKVRLKARHEAMNKDRLERVLGSLGQMFRTAKEFQR